MSDCDAISNILTPHNFTHTNASTCAAGLNGLCDYDCGSFYTDHMAVALAAKLVTIKRLQDSAARILTAAFLHGEFEPDAKVRP
jgi:beta-glucosidase-like glycosyl hydrolase